MQAVSALLRVLSQQPMQGFIQRLGQRRRCLSTADAAAGGHLGERLPDGAAHIFKRALRIRDDAGHAIEVVDHAGMAGVTHAHAGSGEA